MAQKKAPKASKAPARTKRLATKDLRPPKGSGVKGGVGQERDY
jgi:hypothetical protein